MEFIDSWEMRQRYTKYVEATTHASHAHDKFESLKEDYDRGYADADKVRAAEEEYLAAKAEEDRVADWAHVIRTPAAPRKRWEPSPRDRR